jgi:hypothetical protein
MAKGKHVQKKQTSPPTLDGGGASIKAIQTLSDIEMDSEEECKFYYFNIGIPFT